MTLVVASDPPASGDGSADAGRAAAPTGSGDSRFAFLGWPRRVWAVGAVHAESARLAPLHDHVAAHFEPGDRLVYLGNLIGRGPDVAGTIAELLAFRCDLLARPGILASDVVYLRGAQEEMWQKLLQLQFAPNPLQVLRWMLSQGLDSTLAAYGGHPEDGLAAARDGALPTTRWTSGLRDAVRAAPGHNSLYAALRRAAFTGTPGGDRAGTLLVSAGLDPAQPLSGQGDSFWWGGDAFAGIDRAYEGFARVVRGYDPSGAGVAATAYTLGLDGGSGRGGAVTAGLIAPDGGILDIVES